MHPDDNLPAEASSELVRKGGGKGNDRLLEQNNLDTHLEVVHGAGRCWGGWQYWAVLVSGPLASAGQCKRLVSADSACPTCADQY